LFLRFLGTVAGNIIHVQDDLPVVLGGRTSFSSSSRNIFLFEDRYNQLSFHSVISFPRNSISCSVSIIFITDESVSKLSRVSCVQMQEIIVPMICHRERNNISLASNQFKVCSFMYMNYLSEYHEFFKRIEINYSSLHFALGRSDMQKLNIFCSFFILISVENPCMVFFLCILKKIIVILESAAYNFFT
jgi:hypothetical protein